MLPWSVMATAGMPSSFTRLDKLLDVASAVEHGVVGVQMQVNELGHGLRWILR